MTYLRRKFNMILLDGEEKDAVAGSEQLLRVMSDLDDIVVDPSKIQSGSTVYGGTVGPVSISMPFGDAGVYSFFISSDQDLEVGIGYKDNSQQTINLKAVNDPVKGNHPGFLSFQSSEVDYLNLSNAPTGAVINYVIYKIPDLTSPASYRNGAMTTGKV